MCIFYKPAIPLIGHMCVLQRNSWICVPRYVQKKCSGRYCFQEPVTKNSSQLLYPKAEFILNIYQEENGSMNCCIFIQQILDSDGNE